MAVLPPQASGPEAPRPSPATGQGIAVEDPATGEIIGRVPDMTAEVPRLVARGRAAQPAWAGLGFAGRAKVVDACRRRMVAAKARIVASAIRETGQTYEEALLHEVFFNAASLRYWARSAERLLREERVPARDLWVLGRKVMVRYRPLGVIGVIAPWNFPLLLGVGDAIPALMAGNAVVLKPSSLTPLTTRMVVDIFHQAGVPEDVFICATGPAAAGGALVEHADMIAFTGSTATGRKIAAQAGERLIPCSLELGGKDPMIVCGDADLERAVNGAVQFGLLRSGQVCMSVERIYVEEPLYEPFVARLADRVRGLRQGPPGDAGETDLGAMISAEQVQIVAAHVDDARRKGARIVTGGGPAATGANGRFFAPTVVADADHSMVCMREETFGPTLPVMKVRDADEAVQLANDSHYGLTASVWTRDISKGEGLARQVRAGSVCVNDADIMIAARDAPFAGARDSGLGARHGPVGIRRYTEPQTIVVTRFAARQDLGWMPNSRWMTRLLDRIFTALYGR